MVQLFPLHPMDHGHNILTVAQSYNSKNTPIARFHAVKIAKSVFSLCIYNGIPNVPVILIGRKLNFDLLEQVVHIVGLIHIILFVGSF